MFHLRKNKKTVFTAVIVTALCLVLSILLPVTHSQTSNGFTLPCTVTTTGNAWDGDLAFDLAGTVDALVVINTNGTVLTVRESATSYGPAYNVEPDTLMFEGEPQVSAPNNAWPTWVTNLWNLTSNTVESFPNVLSEHDVQYDPVNNTFLTLEDYAMQIGNDSVLFDKIVQVDASGNVIWSWDTHNYIPLSEASPFNETTPLLNGTTVEDFTHANSIDWDYNNSVIYLNLRNQNTFYKINQTTGNIIWACGEFGNFTLLGANGQPLVGANGLSPSLWYHSHDVKEVAPDVFTMFDNDYENNTNPDDCHSEMLEVTLNETSMTARVNWSWEAPIQYWNEYGGGTLILPNGDFIADFGDPTHDFPQNSVDGTDTSWNFNNTGAVFVEVNPAGQVVRTWTFPVGWYVYRIDAITNPTSVIIPPPTPTPTPTPTATPVITPTRVPTQTSVTTPTPTTAPTPTPVITPTPSVSPSSTPSSSINSQPIILSIAVAVVVVAVAVLTVVFYIKKNKQHKVDGNKENR